MVDGFLDRSYNSRMVLALRRLRFLPRNERLFAALLYAAALLVVYAPVTFLGRSLIPSVYLPLETRSASNLVQPRLPARTLDLDISTSAYYEFPNNRTIGQMYLGGELPLWNPYQAAGTPLAAQYSTRAFFPYQILEDVSPYWAWDIFMLLRLWIAGFFTYLLLRSLALSFVPALAGGIFYMLSGAMVWFINLEQMANVAMLVPVLLLFLERLAATGSARYIGWSGLSFGMVLLAGQPEVALYVLLLGGAFFVHQVFLMTRSYTLHIGHYARLGAAFALGLALASPLIVLFLELADISYNAHPPGSAMGVRGTNPLALATYTIVPNFRESPLYGQMLPAPGIWDFLGSYSGILVIFLAYLGVLRGGRHWKLSLFFGGFALVVLLKNFGVPPFLWLGRLPLFEQAWSNRWASPTWAFSLAVAAALGLEAWAVEAIRVKDNVKDRENNLIQWSTKRLLAMSGALICLGLLLGLYTWQDWLWSGGVPGPWRVVLVASIVQGVALGTGITLLGLALAPSSRRSRELTVTAGVGLAIVLAVFLALRTVANLSLSSSAWWIGSSIAALVFLSVGGILLLRLSLTRDTRALLAIVGLALLELWIYIPKGYDLRWQMLQFLPLGVGLGAVLAMAIGRWRWAIAGGLVFLAAFVAIDVRSPHGLPARTDPFKEPGYARAVRQEPGYYRIMGEQGALPPNYAGVFGVQDARFVTALSLEGYQRYVDEELRLKLQGVDVYKLWFAGEMDGGNFFGEMKKRERAYSLLGVRYLLSVSDDTSSDYEAIYVGDGMNVWENENVLPRAYLVHDVELAPTVTAARARALDPRFDPGGSVVLEEDVGILNKGSTGNGATKATIFEYRPRKVVMEVDAGEMPGILVLTDTYYPGWNATVDGEQAHVYRANSLFRGVVVPPGQHQVVMTYLPTRFLAGLAITGVGLLVCIVLIVGPRRLWLRRA